MNQITNLRLFTPADLEPVWSLVQQTIAVSYEPHYSPEVIRFFQDYHPREKILDDAANGHIIVVERDGNIIGTGTIREAHIRRVFIEHSCQGQGIGKQIVSNLEQNVRDRHVPEIDLSSALGARTFWEFNGYSVKEEFQTPTPDGLIIHFFHMFKRLVP